MMNDIPPNPTGPRVVALVYDGLCTFEFAITAEIFGLSRPELGPGWYRFGAAAIEPGPLQAQGGLRLTVDGGLDLLDQADLIIVPGWKGAGVPVPPFLIDRLRAAHDRGARLASICSGAFVLAATGLLDGKRLATHWRYADAMAQAYPAVRLDADVLYVQEGRLFTSAGSAAGIDLMLHIIRSDFGHDAANSVARRLVVPAHRSGGQAQFVPRPVPRQPQSRLSPLLDQMRADPQQVWTVAAMADAAAMSERTFLRRFQEATGHTPGDWLALVRVELAKTLLETTSLPVEEVARLAGFGAPPTLRHHFSRATGLSPRDYRDRFGGGGAGG
ncbi:MULTISPECIES: transcriptional regulator FtrA [unclassified Azospirillum]|uniref:transcriptional regulator FtrA n=1 Tax=unclassified Azospirillum TaxID=2630922 RepID=UPI000B70D1A4|nr:MULTISPECIES: transcriptional regulator FtrA [unclassified Azospirillum]SNS57461.1 transcriptional regulator, AraC family with amidase-like domain [Azospirillum sp. RU38E]SNS77275.1 transcriptional regulator, AraC family with amidase-like domain [Azospirillum sp. RU37A]